jgi:hypothetical protein
LHETETETNSNLCGFFENVFLVQPDRFRRTNARRK